MFMKTAANYETITEHAINVSIKQMWFLGFKYTTAKKFHINSFNT